MPDKCTRTICSICSLSCEIDTGIFCVLPGEESGRMLELAVVPRSRMSARALSDSFPAKPKVIDRAENLRLRDLVHHCMCLATHHTSFSTVDRHDEDDMEGHRAGADVAGISGHCAVSNSATTANTNSCWLQDHAYSIFLHAKGQVHR